MLTFFPNPYSDELFYGACSRYHERSGNASWRHTIQELFGDKCSGAVADLPTNIHLLMGQLSPNTKHTITGFVDNHTLVPFFRPFLPGSRAKKLDQIMSGNVVAGNIHALLGLTASRIPNPRWLRFCPLCLREDERRYGEPYWHRSHQVPGVHVCHRHQMMLLDTRVGLGEGGSRQSFEPLAAAVESCPPRLREARGGIHNQWLAETAHQLLNRPEFTAVHRDDSLHALYRYHLYQQGFATTLGRLHCAHLLRSFLHRYGKEFLSSLRCDISPGDSSNWLLTLLRKPHKASHPIHHLLLINFLQLDLASVLLGQVPQIQPFGNGPWPCLNPACTQFRQAVITTCLQSRNSESGSPIGTFTCACGFTYSRSGPDSVPEDHYRIGRLVSVGPVWERRLWQIAIVERRSFRAAARQLGVAVETVQRHLKRLAVENHDPVSHSYVPANTKLSGYRNRWLKIRGAYPEAGMLALRRLDKAAYTCLYRNDRQWLKIHSPPRQQRSSHKGTVDWAARDAHLFQQIVPAAMAIMQAQGKPIRVTLTRVGKQLGALSLLVNKLNLLPRTRAALDSVVETKDEFAIRRLRVSAQKLLQDGETLAEWKLLRIAGIRPGYSPRIARELKNLMCEKEGVPGWSIQSEIYC